MSKRHIGGERLNGELTRSAQRDLVVSHEYLVNLVASLTQAIREHSDGAKVLARAAEIREKPHGTLLDSASQMRRKNTQHAQENRRES